MALSVTDFEAGKRECEEIEQMFFFNYCILFTTPYNQNIHNEGQRHIIVHTDLKHRDVNRLWVIPATDSVQQVTQVNHADIYVCYLSVSATFHGFKKKKNIISGQGACFTI